jgi:hypothetical protein
VTPRRFGHAAGFGCLLVLLFAPACRAQNASPRVRVPMPAIYEGLWNVNTVCLDRTYSYGGEGAGTVRPVPHVPIDSIKWYVAGDSVFTIRDGNAARRVYGVFIHPDTIVVAGLKLFDARLVRHEMLHAQGVSGHPLIPFAACGLFDGLHGGARHGGT